MPYTPLKVVGQKTGNVGLCGRTQVQVIASKPNPKGALHVALNSAPCQMAASG